MSFLQALSRTPQVISQASKLIPKAFSRGRMVQQAMPHVGGMVTGMGAGAIADHMTSSEPTPEKMQEIQGQVEAYAASLQAQRGIGMDEAKQQAEAEIGQLLREKAKGDPNMLVNAAAFLVGMLPGMAAGKVVGRVGGKMIAGKAAGAEAFLAKAGSRGPREAAVKTRLANRTGAAQEVKTKYNSGQAGMDAGDASAAAAPAAVPPSPTVPIPAAGAPAPEFGRAGMTSADDMLKYAGGAPPTPIVKPGGKSVLAKRKPAMPATTPVPADDLLKSAQAPAADPLAAAASSAAADLRAAKPLVRPTGPVTAIPVSGNELGKAAKYLRDKGHLKPGDEAAFAADAASVTDGPGLKALVEKWSKPRAGGTAEEAIKARMMGFKSSKGI